MEIIRTDKPFIELPSFLKNHQNGFTVRKTESGYSVHYAEMIDHKSMLVHLDKMLEHEPAGFISTHANQECSTLSKKEQLKITRLVVERCAKSNAQVISAMTSNSTATAVEYSLEARDLGVQAILHGMPYYNRATAEGTMLHFRTIRNHVPEIPILMSINSSRSNAEITAKAVLTLFQEGVINGVILEECSLEFSNYILKNKPKGFTVMTTDRLMYFLIERGANNVVSSVGNFDYPRINTIFQLLKEKTAKTLKICDCNPAMKHEASEEIDRMRNELEYLMAAMSATTPPIALKTIMAMLDPTHPELFRAPLCPIRTDLRESLKIALEHCQLI